MLDLGWLRCCPRFGVLIQPRGFAHPGSQIDPHRLCAAVDDQHPPALGADEAGAGDLLRRTGKVELDQIAGLFRGPAPRGGERAGRGAQQGHRQDRLLLRHRHLIEVDQQGGRGVELRAPGRRSDLHAMAVDLQRGQQLRGQHAHHIIRACSEAGRVVGYGRGRGLRECSGQQRGSRQAECGQGVAQSARVGGARRENGHDVSVRGCKKGRE